MFKLYAFQPDGHGPYSFFVMASSLDAAKKAVENYIKEQSLSGYDSLGWDTDCYNITVMNEGEVITNDNS